MYTKNQSPMYKGVPKSVEVAQYLDENRKETNRYYYRQYEHQADYSFADPDYVDAHSVKLGESPESVLIRREAYAALENALRARKEPKLFDKDEVLRQYAENLGDAIQAYADVLEKEL